MSAKFFIVIGALLSVAFFAFAYSPYYTHPDLTEEIAELFNSKNNDSSREISANEIRWLREGAINEDTPPRWINHFYDPVNNVGWQGKHFGNLTPEQGLYQGESMAPLPAIASIDWVTNQEYQSAYGRQYGNQTWQKAIKSYIDGDKRSAFVALGHILHLIEDASVPDHTRNDTHADLFGDPGSPYESYSKEYTNFNTLTVAENLKTKDLLSFVSIQDAFNYLANYSNNNFFSEDTISNKEYGFPDLNILKRKNGYLYNAEKNLYLAKIYKQVYTETYSTNDQSFVLPSYFNNLSSQAVLTGASVLDLFFREVEKYKNTPELLPETLKNSNEVLSSYLKKSPRLALVNTSNFFDKVGTNIKIYANAFSSFSVSLLPAQLSGLISTNAQPQPQVTTVVQPAPTPALVPVITSVVANEPQRVVAPVSQLHQEEATAPLAQPTISEPPQVPATNTASSPVVPLVEDAAILPPPPPVYRGSGSVTGVSPDALLAQNQPAPGAEAQPQSQTENADAFATSTEDAFTETETATTTDGVATSTDDSFATSTDPIIDETATSTDPVIADATSTDPIVPTITDFKDSVVINEVAWMGAKAQANDEWIELYNKTDFDIDLSGWTLESRNKALSVALAGVISSRGYFLLERTASTTTDVAENMVYAGALNNSGPEANVYLKNGSTTIDYIDFGHWPAGDNGKRHTMERVSAYATSTYATNWKAYGDPDAVPFAKDAKGDDIFGTPGRKNSVSGFYTPTGDIAENTIWKKEYSPYLVSSKIIVKDGAELVVEPGVVVKFVNTGSYGGSIDVQGVLRAEGTQAEPIIFTSVRDDDTDGVDSGRDGSTTPAPGDWLNLIFSNSSQSSIMRHTHVRYGGQGISYNPNGWYPTYTGAIHAKGSHPEISDSIIENTIAIGIYANDGGSPKILTNVIENTIQPTHVGAPKVGAGIVVGADASAEIVGNTLKNNSIGVRSESLTDAPVVVKDNRFDGNAKNGEFLKGYTNWNLENSGNEDVNKEGGFDIQFAVGSGQSKTIYADTMPYIIGGAAQVLEGGLLSIEPGAVFKFTVFSSGGVVQFSVNGALFAVGTAENPIVFTAIADDADGYDSNKSPVSPMPGAWKRIEFLGTSSSGSVLEHVIVRYGGQGRDTCPYAYLGGPCMEYSGAVNIVDANPTIRNVEMDDNLAIAVFTDGAANPTIEYSTIRDTKEARKTATTTIGGYGISIGPDSEPILTDNTYANNAEDVVYRE